MHTWDFQRAMEGAKGRNLDGFFQQFVHGAGHPELVVSVAHSDGLLTVDVTQKQSGPEVAEAFHFPSSRTSSPRTARPSDSGCPSTRAMRFAVPMANACPGRGRPDMGVLSKLTLKSSRPLLLAALRDGSSVPVRLTAAAALLEEGSQEAVAAVCAALVDDPFWGVRARLAGALSRRGGDAARTALLGAMDDAHPKARRAIIAALGAFRSADVRDALAARVAAGDASVQVEGEAIKSLGRTRDARVRELAAPLLETEAMDLLRMRAIDALGATRDPAVLGTLLDMTAETVSNRTLPASTLGQARTRRAGHAHGRGGPPHGTRPGCPVPRPSGCGPALGRRRTCARPVCCRNCTPRG